MPFDLSDVLVCTDSRILLFRLFNHAFQGHEIGLPATQHRELLQEANIARHRQFRNTVFTRIAQ